MPTFRFVNTGPKSSQSAREHNLELSRARSHTATVLHKARKDKASASRTTLKPKLTPRVTVVEDDDTADLESVVERTAVEWSGWYDREFWTILVPQAAGSHPTLEYAMAALGAYHESLEAHSTNRRRSCWMLCEKSGNKALESLRLSYDNMSFAAILCCYVALTEFAAVLGQYAFLQALKSQFAIIEDLRDLQAQRRTRIAPHEPDEHYIFTYLAPLMEKQRSRVGHIVDPIYLLRVTPAHHFYVPEMYIPKVFTSLWQARQNLALLLDWTTYTLKTRFSNDTRVPLESDVWLEQWSARLQEFRDSSAMSHQDYCSSRILSSVARVCFMMIENMFSEDQMAFDRYENVYQDFASTASEVLKPDAARTDIRFGVDSGLISLVGWMARIWCRDPCIRRQLIDILLSVKRREGLESTPAWSSVCQWIQQEEESGIVPPPQRACDIPRGKRLRLDSAHFYFARKLMIRKALRYPYDGSRTAESWVSSVPGFHDGPVQFSTAEEQSKPDLILGKGFSSFLKDGRMETIEVHRFTFPIPRT